MKYFNNILCFTLIILASSCDNDEIVDTNQIRTNEELSHTLRNDINFQNLITSTSSFSNEIVNSSKNTLANNKKKRDANLKLDDFEDIRKMIGIEQSLSANYIQEIEYLALQIRADYPELLTKSETQIFEILKESGLPIQKKVIATQRLSQDCDSQFQNSMSQIHANYDGSLYLCAIATILASPAGGGLCAAAATAIAVAETAVAIDEHTVCTQNQQGQ